MSETITVVRVQVGADPVVVEIEKGLKSMQREVEGYIECVRFPDGIDLWVNEEGLLEDLPPNFTILREWVGGRHQQTIVGNGFFAGVNDEGESSSLTKEQQQFVMDLFKNNRTQINYPKE